MAAPGGPRCGGGSLGLLVWLLVFQPLLSEGDGPKEASAVSPTLQGAPSTSGYPTTVTVSTHTGSPAPSTTAVGETLKPAQTPAFEPLPPQGTCGHRIMRIGGRVPSPERKWPWQVSVQVNSVHKCGGSLIAPRWVLTAAHCVRGYSEYTVRLGDTLLQLNSQNAVVIPVQDIICYKYYSYRTMRHDIALALLAFSVNYSAYIQPVCLPGKNFEVKAGTMCWATGWGRTLQFEPSRVPTLQETEQVILHYAKCNRMIKQQENPFPKVVRKGMICGYHEMSGGPCKALRPVHPSFLGLCSSFQIKVDLRGTMGFPGGSLLKNPPASAGAAGCLVKEGKSHTGSRCSSPCWRRSPKPWEGYNLSSETRASWRNGLSNIQEWARKCVNSP